MIHAEFGLNASQPPHVAELLAHPDGLRQALTERGALNFVPYSSGLFPASELTPEMAEATGMGMAWFRDNTHVALALLETGELDKADQAIAVGQCILTVLEQNRDTLDAVVAGNTTRYLTVRVDGQTLENDAEQRVQHDSTGYMLLLTSRLIGEGYIPPTEDNLSLVAQTVRYLRALDYTVDDDQGAWEEDRARHASSMGVVVAGLKETQHMFERVGYAAGIDFKTLIQKGEEAWRDIQAQGLTELPGRIKLAKTRLESQAQFPENITPDQAVLDFFKHYNVDYRSHDAAMLFLVTLGVVQGEEARQIVTDIEQHLLRPMGIARYEGDTYWAPEFKTRVAIEERTTDGEGRIDERNSIAAGVAYSGTEAQWTPFDPLLGEYWGEQHLAGDPQGYDKFMFFLTRSLSQLALQTDGSLKAPEAYFYAYASKEAAPIQLIANDHSPLLWTQANLLRLVKMYERIFGL